MAKEWFGVAWLLDVHPGSLARHRSKFRALVWKFEATRANTRGMRTVKVGHLLLVHIQSD